ncbi:cell division protein ZapA [Crenobacter caeni]|uniref:Cell division protein ZapA n=1 Tax=Crenobacter caeni TaxID=2705474 RepID=A0A6B2KUC9_9NEIS|nr:cell division protein ZapA [Crenobacter caeni]NDV13670.1 cell division protein ZapA [Crenobacter caeni]
MSNLVQVDVNLLGRQFTIATPPQEQDTLRQAVRLLGDKIEQIQGSGRIMDTDKIAIMAALNIAHDLLKTKVGENLEMAEFQRRIQAMVEAADAALGQTQPADAGGHCTG